VANRGLLAAADASLPFRLRFAAALALTVLVFLTTALLVNPARAHRGHAVWTDIVWAQDHFEIVHRMHLADAITVSRYMGGALPIDDMRSLALVALYIEERFVLRDSAGPVRLETVGAETEDDFIFVYQEWTPEALPVEFPLIDNQVLLDVEPESQAFVKIKAPGLNEERER
jgi:hypothetical protein